MINNKRIKKNLIIALSIGMATICCACASSQSTVQQNSDTAQLEEHPIGGNDKRETQEPEEETESGVEEEIESKAEAENESEAETESEAEAESETEADETAEETEPLEPIVEVVPDEDATLCFALMEDVMENPYEGYLDECLKHMFCAEYANKDYDGDGLFDRVYIIPGIEELYVDPLGYEREDEGYNIRIDFGNGEKLEYDHLFSYWSNPYIYSVDFKGDGSKYIVVQDLFENSTILWYGVSSFDIFAPSKNGYIKVADEYVKLPIISYTAVENKKEEGAMSLKANMSILDEDIELTRKDVYGGSISEEEWQNSYITIYDGVVEDEPLRFLLGVKKNGDKECLVMRDLFLDKWCSRVVQYELSLENGKYLVDNLTDNVDYYEYDDDILCVSHFGHEFW